MTNRLAASAVLVAMGSLLAVACGLSSSHDVVIATRDASPPSFVDPDADVSMPDGSGATTALCPTNECPAGRATCPNNPFPCAVDPSTDDDNCGACGHHCPDLGLTAHGDMLHADAHCVKGACQLVCKSGFADCNGFVEDGCEGNLSQDKQNCGACGVVCPGSDVCFMGECVCSIEGSCGTCGNVCPRNTQPPFPRDWHAGYGCVGGQCNAPTCMATWGDCNDDFPTDPAGDGCETNLDNDRNNCSQCGRVCAAGEICRRGICECPCGAPCFQARINTDVENCGGCGFRCPGVSDPRMVHGVPICDEGVCDFRCEAQWADCDGDDQNGCETNVTNDPLNCGGCNVRCSGVDGQACVDGKCAMKECGGVQ
ncbi:MAG: hypothetical protein KF795_31865 [Labilithrix sp.]|nr:hypothetical protein [Labilithrix sp.]